jgi:hypothetical protein
VRIVRSALQLLILLMWGLLLWRNQDQSWTGLAWLCAFFGGLLLLASMIGSRYLTPEYERPAFYTQTLVLVVCVVGLVLPVVIGSLVPLLLLLAWWALLICFLIEPATGTFEWEKSYFQSLGQKDSGALLLLKRSAFVFAFWPIFIPKAIYFWGLILAGSAWLLRDFWLR